MVAVKKIAGALFALVLVSCGKLGDSDSDSNLGTVTFFNNSSYYVSIYQTSFSGPVLADKLATGDTHSRKLPSSDNYGVGSVFSIRYWFWVASDGGDFWTGGIDPNAQITQNIEAGQSYTIQIPQPSKLELAEAFVKILNTSGMPIEFNRLGVHYKQVGNGELEVPSGRSGIYKIDSSEFGVEITGYTVFQQIDQYYPVPEFTAKNGSIYNFEFDGSSVIEKGEQRIDFS
jgi:hypothetical protein